MIQLTGAYLSLLNNWLDAEGIRHPDLKRRIMLLKPTQSVDIKEALFLIDTAASLCNQPAVGLRIASGVRWEHLGALGYMLKGACTLEEMVHRYLLYENLFYKTNLASIVRGLGYCEIFWSMPALPRLLTQLTIGTFVVIVRHLFSQGAIVHVAVPQEPNGEAASYEEFFQCPVTFNADRTLIRFAGEYLPKAPDYSVIQGSQLLSEGGVRSVDGIDREFLQVLVAAISRLLPTGKLNLDQAADSLHMSSRTLQRRLSQYPDGFRGLVSDVRYRQALAYLADRTLPISSVSLLLGYSEQSAFNLAFKRWTGTSPGAWRRSHWVGE